MTRKKKILISNILLILSAVLLIGGIVYLSSDMIKRHKRNAVIEDATSDMEQIIAENMAAIEAAGITPDASTADICEALKASIQTISVEGLTGTITWAASGEPDKEPKAVKIEGGNYVSIED